jgi:quercetin dioxygenase-like cupin family protein
MPVGKVDELAPLPVTGDDVAGVVKRVPLSPREGWEGYVMRVFDVASGGHTPRHAHAWPHINYIVAGRGSLHIDGVDHAVEAGSYALVPVGATHQFSNTGDDVFRLICIVPEEGEA